MESNNEIVLLDEYESMYGMRPRMALALKGIGYESKEEDLDNKSPLLLKMNPIHKKIPVLIHNGKPICESLIIVEYIDEVWNDKYPLLPSDPYKRAQARFWAGVIDAKIYDRLVEWVFKTKDENAIKEEIAEWLKLLEGELGKDTYFGGDKIGFLDLALISFFPWLLAFEKEVNFSMEELVCPKLIEWTKRCLQNETISKCFADPLKISQMVLQMRKTNGVN
ncbi:PREDICTED: probable glutathione S-transferase parA [Ipomoea nil]|uniref:probable glutathione S-transferase parA n=1 Tax=Ipomoea nil TaxID=35883 RepID=UPI00090183DA|nr:PREDICTED: probable glutathione S-transferase parA [Ipomoea nil]